MTRLSSRPRLRHAVLTCAVVLAATSVVAGCGDTDESPKNETHTAANGDEFNDADVAFASDMIAHHAQALAMVDLTTGREIDPELAALAEQIRMAQAPEIEQLTTWLTDWDRPIPETVRDHANAHGDGEVDSEMPGMMSAEEMHELEESQGAEFEELWLELMIEHHEGAVEMAEDEQSDGTFAPALELAAEIESAQQDEISTMKDLLGS